MSIFKFKVSSLSRLKNDSKNSTESIKTPTTDLSKSLTKKENLGEDTNSSKVSQFVIDENDLWIDDEDEIFDVSKGQKFFSKRKKSYEDLTTISSVDDVKKLDYNSPKNEEVKLEEVNCDKKSSVYNNFCSEITCFDLCEESSDCFEETKDLHIENSESPTFDVPFSKFPKQSNSLSDCEKENSNLEKLTKVDPDFKSDKIETCESFLPFEFPQEKLNPLGLAEDTGNWLENILQNEAFVNTSDLSEHKLQNNLSFLNKTYVEVLEKAMAAFEALPIDLLKKFPQFDTNVYMTLRTTRRRIKAVIIKTENLLKRNNSSQFLIDNQNNDSLKEIGDSQSKVKSPVQKNFGKFNYSLSSGGNNTLEDYFTSKSEETYRESSKLMMGKPKLDTVQQKLSFPTVQTLSNNLIGPQNQLKQDSLLLSPKTCTSNLGFIDYTDVLYKSPAKETHERIFSMGKFHGSMRNDGTSGEFDGLNFPHSKELLETFHKKFGLRNFRPNQLQVINAVLLGHDCFVLMPTGGGKSLCYQLPAIVSKGVTVVISPLRSLILDQVTKLLTLDISAAHLSGDIKDSEASLVYRKLNQPEPAIKLLYVTPEKVGVSTSLRNCLMGLYKRSKLARFVIDEAHCVSQWGHDFRPDYKKLRELRENFPNVNIMALTATATPRVRTDILHQLKVVNPKWFLSSFNRTNLTYSVKEKKGKTTLKEIANLIQNEFKKDTGVIYCFSRKECEDVAKDLKEYGILAIPYHAGLNDNERTRAQNLWMNGKVKVVCATIAFGMGIDKLDVRFVIHFSLPKSIEGYYQESGRAGRDGEKATCVLYYSYRDKIRMLKLINMDKSVGNQAAKKVHIDNLFRVVAFAENKTDCRRSLQLEYFGEKFDRKRCLDNRNTACDNCLQQGLYETIDVTSESMAIVSGIKKVCDSDDKRNSNYTMLHFVDVFKGTVIKKVLAEGHNNLSMYGLGKSWQRLDVERLFRKLIMEEFLKERLMVKDDGITFAYLKIGSRGEELLKGNLKIMFEMKKRKGSSAAQNSVKIEEQINPAILEIQEKCYSDLMDAIREIASSVNCNPNAIMNVQALRTMSLNLPETAEEMLSINHVTTANFEKYGNILLDITKKYASEKKSLEIIQEPEEDIFEDGSWLDKKSDDSPYFETDITFCGKSDKKRKKPFRGWQNSKKRKEANNSSKPSSTKSKTNTKVGGKTTNKASGITTVPVAKYSTLMELPTNKARGFPRPKMILKNL